jgi:hypothetical protein
VKQAVPEGTAVSGVSFSPLIETAIGVVFVWFLASALCSGIVELVSSSLGFRATNLWQTLDHALGTPPKSPPLAGVSAARMMRKVEPSSGSMLDTFVESLPGVTQDELRRVRRIDPAVASEALVAAWQSNPAMFNATQLGQLMSRLPDTVQQDANQLREWFANWFDGEMKTSTVVFRRNIRWWTALVSIIIVVVCGLDSIGLVQRLYHEPTERLLIEAEADHAATKGADLCPAQGEQDKTFQEKLACAQHTAQDLSGLRVSLWQVPEQDRSSWWLIAFGFAATIAAIAAGAPFWFDVLRRLTGLRRAPPTT